MNKFTFTKAEDSVCITLEEARRYSLIIDVIEVNNEEAPFVFTWYNDKSNTWENSLVMITELDFPYRMLNHNAIFNKKGKVKVLLESEVFLPEDLKDRHVKITLKRNVKDPVTIHIEHYSKEK